MTIRDWAIQAQQLGPLAVGALLPPDVAYQATIAAYVMIGSVGALIWDILLNVGSDYQLLFRHKITVPTITYFLSRASTLADVIVNVTFQTTAQPNCLVLQKMVCVLYHVAFSSTSLLFFLRIRAVFNEDKLVVAFFFVLWLAVSVGSLTIAIIDNAVHFGPTQDCRGTSSMPYSSAAPIAYAVNDTFVFLAISWKLLKNAGLEPSHKSSLKSKVLGENLPAFTRVMLQDGQIYYLVSVTSNTAAAVVTWTHSIPLAYRIMLTVLNVALTNMMACRVYRHTKFCSLPERPISTRWITSQLAHRDGSETIRRPGSLCFAPLQRAQSEISNANPPQVFSLQENVVAQKISPIEDVEAGNFHRIEKLEFSKSDKDYK